MSDPLKPNQIGNFAIGLRSSRSASRQSSRANAYGRDLSESACEASRIAWALGGRKVGSGWLACCPAHDDRKPSLSIDTGNDGKVLLHCHAGCDQRQLIAALRERGLWEKRERFRGRYVRSQTHSTINGARDGDDLKRTEAALRLWRASSPASGTLVEAYLQSRGLTMPLPAKLRFHPGLGHREGGLWPAMVALVTRGTDDTPLAIHRTFLALNGAGKAPVEPAKMMLGPCRGGAVRLAPAQDLLMVGEGIETCLSAMQADGTPAWAALSTSGLRALDLPNLVRKVIVLADGDESGEAAARDAALRWTREGRDVRIARPPNGSDFNDMLLGLPTADEEACS